MSITRCHCTELGKWCALMLRRLLHNLRTTPPTSAPNPDKPHVTEADLQDVLWRRHFEILHVQHVSGTSTISTFLAPAQW